LVVTAGMCVSETLADEVVVMMIMAEGKRLKVEGGRWKVEDGRWKMEGGRWKVEDGRWKMEGGRCRKFCDRKGDIPAAVLVATSEC